MCVGKSGLHPLPPPPCMGGIQKKTVKEEGKRGKTNHLQCARYWEALCRTKLSKSPRGCLWGRSKRLRHRLRAMDSEAV